VADFFREDLQGSRFERVDLSGAQFRTVDLSGATFRGVYLLGLKMRGVELVGVDINGEIENVTIMVSTSDLSSTPSSTGAIPNGPRCVPLIQPAFGRLWTSSRGFRARRSPGPDGWTPSCCMSPSTVNGHSSRRCGTWCLLPIPGSDGRSWAIRRHGIRWICHGTRCLARRAYRETATPDRLSMRCSNCAAIV
jgi:hypothetical protein